MSVKIGVVPVGTRCNPHLSRHFRAGLSHAAAARLESGAVSSVPCIQH